MKKGCLVKPFFKTLDYLDPSGMVWILGFVVGFGVGFRTEACGVRLETGFRRAAFFRPFGVTDLLSGLGCTDRALLSPEFIIISIGFRGL